MEFLKDYDFPWKGKCGGKCFKLEITSYVLDDG